MTDTLDTFPARFAAIVRDRGAQPALITPARMLTYTALEQETSRLARALVAAGAGKGARIGLLAPDGEFWITAFLAGLRIGALVTTISTLAAPPELKHILRNSDVQFLLSARCFLNHDYAQKLETAFPELKNSEPGALMLEEAPYLRAIWLDDAQDCPWALPTAELVARAVAPGAPDQKLLAAIEREVAAGDDAIVVYTSGSTGMPKAVVHRQWAAACHSPVLAGRFVLTPEDRMMTTLPAFWLAGMSVLLQVFSIGATLVCAESNENDAILDMIALHGVTRINAWGDKLPKLEEAAKARGQDISAIPDFSNFKDSQGNDLPPKISMYGMTESFSAHSSEPLNVALPAEKSASYGRAINGYERRVVDPETGAELPPGQVGELQIRGPALMSGFYKKRREEVFTPDGFYPTRDLVSIDEEGWLYPAGRRDDMIKTRGANVSRLEVEAALNALPEVELSVAAGLPDAEFGKLLVAAVVAAPGAVPTEDSLKAALKDTLSSFKIPRRIVFISQAEIPRTQTGKIKIADAAAMIAERLAP